MAGIWHWPACRSMDAPISLITPRRGRPRKFAGPSRPITLTLPVETIEALSVLDPDLSRAIVRLVRPEARRRHAAAELATFGRRAVIVVNNSRALERRIGVDLVPLSDGRSLIAFENDITPDTLELRLEDALEDRSLTAADRGEFEAILEILKRSRRSGNVAVLRRNIIVLEGRAPARGVSRDGEPVRPRTTPKSRRSTK